MATLNNCCHRSTLVPGWAWPMQEKSCSKDILQISYGEQELLPFDPADCWAEEGCPSGQGTSLGLERLGSIPCSATDILCDVGQIT